MCNPSVARQGFLDWDVGDIKADQNICSLGSNRIQNLHKMIGVLYKGFGFPSKGFEYSEQIPCQGITWGTNRTDDGSQWDTGFVDFWKAV
jgi:hypothetical protein